MNPTDRTRLSKLMALILRHGPARFGLSLDAEGYVALDRLHAAVAGTPGWAWVTPADILEVVATSDKKRFELRGDQIRARYGHSVATTPDYPAVVPPARLYHGTSRRAAERILREGLHAQRRRYVHLSATRDMARQVGGRHDRLPVILEIAAAEAHAGGVEFYRGGEDIYLARSVPPEFIYRLGPP